MEDSRRPLVSPRYVLWHALNFTPGHQGPWTLRVSTPYLHGLRDSYTSAGMGEGSGLRVAHRLILSFVYFSTVIFPLVFAIRPVWRGEGARGQGENVDQGRGGDTTAKDTRKKWGTVEKRQYTIRMLYIIRYDVHACKRRLQGCTQMLILERMTGTMTTSMATRRVRIITNYAAAKAPSKTIALMTSRRTSRFSHSPSIMQTAVARMTS